MVKYDFDFVVIGAGSGGLTAVDFALQIGFKTMIVEQEHFGGDCTWHGCVPSKAIIHSAELSKHQSANTKGAPNPMSMQYVHDYVQGKIRDVYAHESDEVHVKKGIEVRKATAELVDEHTVRLHTKSEDGNKTAEVISAKFICIATGAQPRDPKIEGMFDEKIKDRVWSYQEIWGVKELPNKLAVIGGGPIGSELAQAFSRLGSEVTIIASSLLPRESQNMRDIVLRVFEEEGIKHVQGRPKSVKLNEETNLLELTTEKGETFAVDGILYSVGRTAVLPLNADNVLKVGPKGGLIVDEYLRCQTRAKGKVIKTVFAAGDCIEGNFQFTHYAGKQGYVCARNAFLVGKTKGMVAWEIPRVTFTSPEIASIGFTSVEEAQKNGFKNAVSISLGGDHIDRAVTDDEQDRTLYELILSDGSSVDAKIIGANVASKGAGETLSMICVALKLKISLIDFADVVLPYPTYAFGLMTLAASETTKRFAKSKKAALGKALNF